MHNSAGQREPGIDPNLLPVTSPRMWSWHIPAFLEQMLPRVLIDGMRDLKGRILTRNYPRHITFAQSLEDALASASVSIIVPIHDAPVVTSRCLASLEKYATESEIILVDDASNLIETTEVIGSFSCRNGWRVIRHEKPLGHSGACEAGAKLATRPYLCLLNSDTVVTPWCWRQVKEVFEHDQKIGVAGPSTSHGGAQTLDLASVLSPYWNDNQIYVFANRLLTQFQEPVVTDLPWIAGFAFFIRRGLWEELGGFDRNLRDYGNEVELCNRVSQMGYRNVWIRNSYIHHFGHQSYRASIGDKAIRSRIRAAELYNSQNDHTLDP
jgi:GT2 family glycosyltransferase